MEHIDQLKLEINRLGASEVEIIYSDESTNEYELQFDDEQTVNLEIEATLLQLKSLSDNAGSQTFWERVVDSNNSG